jgi:glycosyltransferase involved in cell wall biosynthesis
MSTATVVLPAYNAGETIGQSVRSALAQVPSVPVIVVDDGSDDDTADIAEREGATVIRAEHRGLADAVNAMWRAATTPWCYFSAADDWMGPDAVAALLGALAGVPGHGENSTPALVYSDLMLHDRFGEPRGQTWTYRQESRETILRSLRATGQAPIPSSGGCLWSREWLERVGGFAEPICADTDMLSRAVLHDDFAALYVPGARYHYRWSPAKVQSAQKAEVTVRIMERHFAQKEDYLRKWFAWGCCEAAGAFWEASR